MGPFLNFANWSYFSGSVSIYNKNLEFIKLFILTLCIIATPQDWLANYEICGKRIFISYWTYYESYKTMENGNDFNATCESKMSVPDNGKRKNMNTWGQKSQMTWKVVCQR